MSHLTQNDIGVLLDYEGWIKYYLRGVRSCAEDIVKRAWAIDSLLESCGQKLEDKPSGIRKNANKLLYQLCQTPVMTINDVAELLESTYQTAQKLVNTFVDLEILERADAKQRNKVYNFRVYLNILEKEFTG